MKKKNTKKQKIPKAKTQELKIIVEQRSQPIPELSPKVLDTALAPEKQGSKLMLAPSWLSEKQVLRMLQKTPAIHVQERPGKAGMKFKYVTGTYMKKMLNFTFGWNWDFQIVSKDVYGLESGRGQIVICGKLTVKDDKGHVVSKEQFGQADIKYLKDSKNPMSMGQDFKSAATDALKKCAAELGFASDIYGANEFKEIQEEFPNSPVSVESKKLAEPATSYEYHSESGATITKAEHDYSMKMYGMPLSRGEMSSGKYRPKMK